jgi:hypothetical protein
MSQPFLGRESATAKPDGSELTTLARVEGLIGEERALLDIPAHQRTAEQHTRLREIAEELDRLWATLRERADRLSHHHGARETEG